MDIVQARLLGFPIDPIIKKEIIIKTTKFFARNKSIVFIFLVGNNIKVAYLTEKINQRDS
tara:strand:+ start:816 stop:995 length:180 start_codon:yes stop_codon:yes gene_type:complete